MHAIESAGLAGEHDALLAEAWGHAALVARIARDLAPIADVDPVDAAAAGLLHDVGELLLLIARPGDYAGVKRGTPTHRGQLTIEKATFQTDHALLGAEHLLDHRMPDVIADAVADHHDPFRDSAATTIVVAAADEIVAGDPTHRHALELLGIRPETAAVILRSATDGSIDDVPLSDRDRMLTQ
jgi:putative nucleotidyltransferase with HDIG domain